MKFSIIVNKLANFYFFVQNLSEWHFSNRKEYNTLWRKELGRFSPKEESSLKRFREIHLRYPFGKSYLGRYFFTEEDPWVVLNKILPQDDFINLQDIFTSLENKFNSFWYSEEELLLQWREELNNKMNNPSLIEPIVGILEIVFNTPPLESEIKVNLLPSSPDRTGGGANINSENISLEISRYPIKGVNHAMGIIWHETIHLCFQNQYFFPLILKQFPNNSQKADLVNEVVISSLFPRGILGIRLLKNKPAQKLVNGVDSKQTIKLLDLTKEYIDNKKYLDEVYIKRAAEVLRI